MPSPRDIDEVLNAWRNLPEDQLHVKYFKEYDAYQQIRKFFLGHPEYTHLVLCPDDLVIMESDLQILKDDLTQFDFPVVSGMSNVNLDKPDMMNIMIGSIPSKTQKSREPFSWNKFSDFESVITPVLFSGFPCMVIRRDVVEKIDFDSEGKIEGNDPNSVGNLDIIFCHNCNDEKIPIHVDKRARMLHLRNVVALRVGLDEFPPEVRFYRGGLLQFSERFPRY